MTCRGPMPTLGLRAWKYKTEGARKYKTEGARHARPPETRTAAAPRARRSARCVSATRPRRKAPKINSNESSQVLSKGITKENQLLSKENGMAAAMLSCKG
ncbi:hypothetical protein NDU88_008610 [Pleurodeles waltl]|uniref:Uncharacterized protein n=1 Tax=Pleurodeles waltl TaxID=8319 RepID=A0AAV7N9D0_PLEWA|nr:hypothetical protein NDU88_008610 [Pleurodeles waltl]